MWWSKKKVDMRLRWAAASAFVVMVVTNILANSLPINGQNTAAISDKYANLFAPAGITFVIWGVIYASLALYTLYQLQIVATGKKSRIKTATIETITPYYIGSSVLNTVWILTWHYEIMWMTVLLIVAMLGSLIVVNRELAKSQYTTKEYWLVRAPFSVYFGWITVATIANITAWLVSIGWNGAGLSDVFWVVTILIVGALIGIKNLAVYRDWLYGAVLVWAYAGIVIKHVSQDGWNGEYPAVIGAVWSLLVIVAVASVYTARTQYIAFKK